MSRAVSGETEPAREPAEDLPLTGRDTPGGWGIRGSTEGSADLAAEAGATEESGSSHWKAIVAEFQTWTVLSLLKERLNDEERRRTVKNLKNASLKHTASEREH